MSIHLVPYPINNNIVLGSDTPLSKAWILFQEFTNKNVCELNLFSDRIILTTRSILHHYSLLKQMEVCFGTWPQSSALHLMSSKALFIDLHEVKWLPMKQERTSYSLSCFQTPDAWITFKLYSKCSSMCICGLIVCLSATEIRSRGMRQWKGA